MFEMSETAGSDGQSCVVNDWLTHDDDDDDVHGGTDEAVDSCSSLVQPTTRLTVAVTESPVKHEILSTMPYWQTVPTSLDFTGLIVDLVYQYAAQVSSSPHRIYFCLFFFTLLQELISIKSLMFTI